MSTGSLKLKTTGTSAAASRPTTAAGDNKDAAAAVAGDAVVAADADKDAKDVETAAIQLWSTELIFLTPLVNFPTKNGPLSATVTRASLIFGTSGAKLDVAAVVDAAGAVDEDVEDAMLALWRPVALMMMTTDMVMDSRTVAADTATAVVAMDAPLVVEHIQKPLQAADYLGRWRTL